MAFPNTSTNTVDTEANQRIRATTTRTTAGGSVMTLEKALKRLEWKAQDLKKFSDDGRYMGIRSELSSGTCYELGVEILQEIAAIKEALANHIEDNLTMVAQPEQEPVAFIDMREWPPIRWRNGMVRADVAPFDGQGLFFSSPQRKPLTDEQIDSIADKFTVHTGEMWEPELCIEFNDSCKSVHSFAHAIEAAHGIKATK